MGGLSAVISQGKRAITVRVNDVIGVAGFALPGNYVDIIVNTQREGEQSRRDQTISKIVLEKILVLAVAQEVSRDKTKPRVVNAVTLEVAPEEAEKIDLARSVGSLSLVLRNQIDPHATQTTGITKNDLIPFKQEGSNSSELQGAKEKINSSVARKKNPKEKAIDLASISEEKNSKGAQKVQETMKECVGVLTGIQSSSECY